MDMPMGALILVRLPNLALQRTLSAIGASSPRANEKHARVSLGGHLCGAAERGR